MDHPEEIWNLLHDGGIADVHGDIPGDVTFRIEVDYLTRRMKPPCDAFELTLLGCESFEYLNWNDDRRTSDLRALIDVEPEILSASATPDGVSVICTNGQFDIRYTDVHVTRSDRTVVSIAEIEETAIAYWDAFGATRGG